MAYNFTDIGDSEAGVQQDATAEERKRRLAMLASLASGVPLGDVAGKAIQDRTGELANKYEAATQAMGMNQPVSPVQPEQTVQPQVQAQAPVAPVSPTQPQVTGEVPEIGKLPEAGPAVQTAGPVNPAQAGNLQISPGINKQVVEQAQTQTQAPVLTPDQTQQLNLQHHEAIINAANTTDPTARRTQFATLLADKTVSEDNKKLINQQIAQDYFRQKGISDAEEKIAKATPNDLARYMQSKSEDGSYLKAILFQRLGLTELAKEEQQKLGAGVKMASAVDATTGQRYTVERNANGEITNAFNTEGKRAGQEEIARLSAATLPTQAHQLPAVHGSPVVNAQGQTGLLMYDPQSQSSYVQVGNQRLAPTGWTTMAQNVSNVYNAAQAKELGTGAGQGFTPSPMRPLPGVAGTGAQPQVMAPTTPSPAGAQTTVTPQQRAEADVAGLQREIANTPRTPANQGRLQILNQELAKAQQQVGAVQGLPPQAQAAQVPGGGIAQQKANLAIQEAQQKEGIQVAGQRSQAFNKVLDEEIRPQAQNGDTIVSTRKQQFAIFDRPGVDVSKIFGIANGAGRSPQDQSWTMLRDVLLGKTTATDDQIRERAAALGLNREEQSALAEYNIANAKINAATLKSTAGAGSVSDAEQRANREMNVDPTKIPGMGAFNAMAQSQFSGDMARYKADWASTHPATNALQLDKAWRKESQQLTEMYANIAKERAKFITDNGATTPAVKEAYKRFPVPEYDPATETWKKTKPLSQIFGR